MTSAIVTCNQTEASWTSYPETLSLTNSADVWLIPVVSDQALITRLEKFLLQDESEKSLRFRHSTDKHRFITRKAALRILLSKYLGFPAKSIQFLMGENKKPCLKPKGADIYYNVSHSGNYILIAVSDHDLGVDIEQINPAFDFKNVLNETFSREEIEFVLSDADPEKAFFKLWTRKESLTKATAKGLDDDFAAVPCLDGQHQTDTALLWSDENWIVQSFEINNSYAGSVAYAPSKSLRFFYFDASRENF